MLSIILFLMFSGTILLVSLSAYLIRRRQRPKTHLHKSRVNERVSSTSQYANSTGVIPYYSNVRNRNSGTNRVPPYYPYYPYYPSTESRVNINEVGPYDPAILEMGTDGNMELDFRSFMNGSYLY